MKLYNSNTVTDRDSHTDIFNDLNEAIEKNINKDGLYDICKALRNNGVSSGEILECIDGWIERRGDFRYFDSVFSALTGDCHQKYSLV